MCLIEFACITVALRDFSGQYWNRLMMMTYTIITKCWWVECITNLTHTTFVSMENLRATKIIILTFQTVLIKSNSVKWSGNVFFSAHLMTRTQHFSYFANSQRGTRCHIMHLKTVAVTLRAASWCTHHSQQLNTVTYSSALQLLKLHITEACKSLFIFQCHFKCCSAGACHMESLQKNSSPHT